MFRNYNREFILGASQREEIVVEPLLAEIDAIRWCLVVAKSLQFQKIIIHSDCLNATDCINRVKSLFTICYKVD